MARRAVAEAHDDHEGLESPVENVTTKPQAVKSDKSDKKVKAIEVNLPLSVSVERDKFIGDDPIKNKLAKDFNEAIRKTAGDAASASVVGQMQSIWNRMIGVPEGANSAVGSSRPIDS